MNFNPKMQQLKFLMFIKYVKWFVDGLLRAEELEKFETWTGTSKWPNCIFPKKFLLALKTQT